MPSEATLGLAPRLAVDVLAMVVLVRGIHFRRYQHTELYLTFFTFNLTIFLITFLMNQVELTMGAAFGLFAVFSMLRFRTESLSARDMTYLFVVIALGLVMAVARTHALALAGIAGAMLLMIVVLEGNWLVRREHAQPMVYENIRLVHAQERAALIADLSARTGLAVHRVDVQEIDFVRDMARLIVYYSE